MGPEIGITADLLRIKLEKTVAGYDEGLEKDVAAPLRSLLGIMADTAEKILELAAAGIADGSPAYVAGSATALLTAMDELSGQLSRLADGGSDKAADDRAEEMLVHILREKVIPSLTGVLGWIMPEDAPVTMVSGEEAEEWAGSVEVSPVKQVICMFGYGDGLCYEYLCRRTARDSTVIVYEPEKDTIQDLKEQLIVNVDYYMLDQLTVCAHPLYKEIFASEYAEFIHAINENRERILVNKNTMTRFRDNSSRNVIVNLPMLREFNPVSDLASILPPEIPVIIVSAGPSLDKNVELLKQAKGHCLIFAVDTAMKYLLSRGIIPDLGITVEPIKPIANYEDDRCFDVPHVFDPESNPEIVGRHRARKFMYNCRDYVRRLLEAAGKEVPATVASGGSVATAAFAVCYQLGVRTVIMIGQDLAYSGTATHAGGIESKGINNEIGYETVEGIDGSPVRTRSDWLGYQKWFESGIRVAKEIGRDLTVVDATEGGALIHGTEVMSLAEALLRYCGVDVTGTADVQPDSRIDYDFDGELKKLPYFLNEGEYSHVRELIDLSFTELQGVRDAALKGAEACDRYIVTKMLQSKSPKHVEVPKTGPRGVPMECTISREICEGALLYPLINNYAVCDIADEVARLRAKTDDPTSAARQQLLAFKAIVGACDYFDGLRGETL